jgi:VWFA-related protein
MIGGMAGKRTLTIVMVCALSILAQEPVIHVTTRMVEVNVIVRDRHGPVAGLTKDDFTIFDKGKPQKIAFFSANSTRHAPAAGPSPTKSTAPASVFTNRPNQNVESPSSVTVVLLDGLNTRIEDQVYAKRQFVKFLGQIRPDDRIAVYTLGNGLRVLHDFSSDSRSLLNAVARFNGENLPFTEISEPDPANTGSQDLDTRLNDLLQGMADRAIINRVRLTSTALIAIANHVSHLPGRKTLVWVSSSFPFSLGACGGENPTDWNQTLQGDGSKSNCMQLGPPPTTTPASGRGNRSAGSPTGGGTGPLNPPGPSEFMMPNRENLVFDAEIRKAMQALNAANVVIDPVDARGLMSAPRMFTAAMPSRPSGSAPPRFQDMQPTGTAVMEMVAADTGGRAFYNTNDIQGAIRQAIDDAEVTYTLGFYPDSKALDSQYHSLRVHVDRKDVDLRYRKGYIASADSVITETDREQIVRDALWSPLAATGIALSAKAEHIDQSKPDQSKSDSMKIVLTIDLDQLQFRPDAAKRKAEIQIAFEQRSADGKALGTTERVVPVVLDEDRYQSKQPVTLTKTLSLSAGVSEIRVALYDRRSENVGSLVIPVAGKNSASR